MRICLVRHGESEANKINVLQGHLDYALTKLGSEQAEKLASYFENNGYSFDLIFSSDLKRAMETTKVITSRLNYQGKIEYSSDIRELDWGDFAGRKREDLDEGEKLTFTKVWRDYSTYVPEGESVNLLIKRLKMFLKTIEEWIPQPNTVLIVTHGGAIYALLNSVMGVLPSMDSWFDNGMFSEVVKEPLSSQWKLEILNGKPL